MCRLLAIKSNTPIDMTKHLTQFGRICKNSKEFQGHGWGIYYFDQEKKQFKLYRNIMPIWGDELDKFGNTTYMLVHARSAFKNEGIRVENNMPFMNSDYQFIFNGELHDVRIKENGRIGAEKIFNYIQRFIKNDIIEGLTRGISIINTKSGYVRALNLIMGDRTNLYLYNSYNEDPDYFQLYTHFSSNTKIVSSKPYGSISEWDKVPIEKVIKI